MDNAGHRDRRHGTINLGSGGTVANPPDPLEDEITRALTHGDPFLQDVITWAENHRDPRWSLLALYYALWLVSPANKLPGSLHVRIAMELVGGYLREQDLHPPSGSSSSWSSSSP